MNPVTTIQISTLPLITDAETFFNTAKILYIDVVDIDDAPGLVKLKLGIKQQTFKHNGKLYLMIILKGSPEKLILNGKRGILHTYGDCLETIYFFTGNLIEELAHKKIFDFSEYYRRKDLPFVREDDFWIERCITPFEPAQDHKCRPAKQLQGFRHLLINSN